MANNNNRNNPNSGQSFWDFVQAFDPHHTHGAGAGVDHAQDFGSGFPFEGPWAPRSPWGPHHGRPAHPHREGGHQSGRDEQDSDNNVDKRDPDDEESPETMRNPPGESPEERHGPSPGDPHHPHPPPPPHHHHHHHHPFGRRGHMGRCARDGRGGRGGRGGHRDRHEPAGHPPAYEGPFDMRPIMYALSSHPLAQGVRDYVEQARANSQAPQENQGQQDGSFVPPLDIFTTEKAYVIHISLPGAVKDDVGVNWDAEKSLLNVAGVVYRPGNEEFIQCLTSSERRVGMFERSIKLPPPEIDEKEDIDAFGITARMDNGILIITVPKMEKETWTEIHKVDVE
ncbi:heat shock 16 [Apiospora aurea]|uniref:Heat shock 16 n=1 Tax=Apiospora aurea TaxID=335848 RepID=A0ABR1PVL8_9PEZI